MANEEHLTRLKQGVEAWNQWREANPNIKPDLSEAHLSEINLQAIDLSGANLAGAHLSGTGLSEADLSEANLSGAELVFADLTWADLSGAHFFEAYVGSVNFSDPDLTGTHFGEATFSRTILGGVDLSAVRGLETAIHNSPSIIGIDTLYHSKGHIPEVFLRGCGVPDEFITYVRSLVGHPFEYHSCFISYSSKDTALAERLYADLQAIGVRCWFAPKDMKIGDSFRSRIDEAIHLHDKLLLILSKHSVVSPWVEKEVETAFGKEAKDQRSVLFPIRVDQAIMQLDTGWAADIYRTRHIGDFRRWKNHDDYRTAFDRLLRDLKAASQ